MASSFHPEMPCSFRFEFDPANKILLMRFEGRLTNESLAALYSATLKYWSTTGASASIADYSSLTEFAASSEFIRDLAIHGPVVPDATNRPRFIVAPTAIGFGLARMFQILAEPTRPLLKVVHTMDQALTELGVQSPHFELLE